jgi:hypothetical protein
MKIKEVCSSMFEGADKVFEMESCGGFRRGEENLKDISILITRNDDGPTKYLLLKLIELLEN